ncbi:MAG: ferredoxin--NADP reductase [Acidobacteria bacterium]|nr:ferredoxin--NADP reductase [Acidobacteriota bacterium]
MAEVSEKFAKAVISERRDLSHDLWLVRLKSEHKLSFQPGQYATFGVVEDAKVVERPYSIVSSPYEDTLEFFIELVPEGELTPRLHKLQVGAELVLRKVAKGRFTLDHKSGRKKHLLVATVTGVAPYCSMVRTLQRDWKDGKFPEGFQLFLLQGASRSWEFGYREEMEKVAAEAPWFTYIPTISRPWEDASWQGEVGRCEDILRKYTDQFELTADNTTGYLCGHPQMIENAKGILQRRGFPKESLREEQYWVQK